MEEIKEEIGIYILNYNGINWLKKNLNNIIKNSGTIQIIIIDNNSHDNSVDYIEKHFPKVEIYTHKTNYGFSKGYNNVLLKENRFKYYILLNNDVKVTENWINPMLDLFNRGQAKIVQPKILSAIKEKQFDYAGAAGGFIDIMGIPFCRGRIFNTLELDCNQYNDSVDIFWASGCCFMIESKLFKKLNGLDEDLFMHQEEIDLCWRGQKENIKILYCPQSTIYHYGGGTLSTQNPLKSFYNHRNNLLILIKNLPIYLLMIIIPVRIIIDYSLIISNLISGLLYLVFISPLYLNKIYDTNIQYGLKKIKKGFLILFAHISVIFLLKKFIKKRAPIYPTRVHLRSIIFDYYIMRIKQFSKLKKF
ncbi:MAG: hypothetical protein CMP49_01490 [Flavobacteriales bacterium]|nr:hypothetical protein [Flavobacteriales bacterium]|tara:strand:+ start:17193 stop:18278 length:1086 start_codon:yes stop_codon:yes gene_type:complete